ncbi:MAG: AAA family ATPase, partial [Gemmatimonadaceae bacterium]
GRLALPLARRARDADPADERLWRRVLEVHLAARDVVGAATEADAFEHFWQAEERELEAASRALLRRARDPSQAQADVGSESATIVAALVGRATEFATLTSVWDELQRTGRSRHVHIAAPSGLGKTRLLNDLRSRLRASRARVVLVRANPGERALPYALVSTFAQSMAALPGAAAIAPAAANVLVQLNPALSSQFPEAVGGVAESEPLRRRTVAIRELVAAVSFERPVAVLVDDLHWADRESLAVLAACAGNFGEGRIMLVTSARGAARQWFAHDPAELALPPLDARAIGELIASLGQLPDAPWADELPALLLGASGGSPLLALEMLQLATERELLAVREGHWTCSDTGAMRALFAETNPLEKRIGQVDSGSRLVLALLSAAGVPCSTHTLSTAAAQSPEVCEGMLQALEVRGLVQRTAEHWLPAHDEIAASMLATIDAREVAHARLTVARAVVADPSADLAALRLAAELLVASGESGELAELFARFTRTREATGVHGTPEEHLRALIGDALPVERRLRVLRSTSWRSRLSYGGLALLGAAALGLGALGWRRTHAPEVVLVLQGISSDSSGISPRAIALRADDPLPESIELATAVEARLPGMLESSAAELSAAPDGSGWYTQRTYPDSGGDEVVFVNREGGERRLTHSPGDDGAPVASPDNLLLYFSTSRFDARMHSQVARLDLASGGVTPFTTGPDVRSGGMPAPDGSSVAFGEADFDSGDQRVCVEDTDATHRRCLPNAGTIVGWRDESHLWALSGRRHDSLVVVETERLATSVACAAVSLVRLSPDRHWMLVSGARAGFDGRVFWLARSATPCDGAVLLVHGRPLRQAHAVWDLRQPSRDYLAHIRIAHTPEVQSFAPVQLFAEGRTAAGSARGIGALRWRSLDTAVAVVSEQGLLIPRADGAVRVVASAGGFRADTATLHVRSEPPRLLERTTWDGPQGPSAWYVFGAPPPAIDSSGAHRIFSMNGDSSYTNGLRLRMVLDARHGLVVRARLRYRVVATQWQSMQVAIDSRSSDSAWTRWDRSTGAPPHSPLAFAHCELAYPSSEGASGLETMYLALSAEPMFAPVPRRIRGGDWVWEEVQMLPDGRCGVAVDGQAMLLSRVRQPVTAPMEVLLSGQSHGTRMLVDTIEVYAGVLHPEWWLALDLRRRTPDSSRAPTRR